jgi:hypothetical protein
MRAISGPNHRAEVSKYIHNRMSERETRSRFLSLRAIIRAGGVRTLPLPCHRPSPSAARWCGGGAGLTVGIRDSAVQLVLIPSWGCAHLALAVPPPLSVRRPLVRRRRWFNCWNQRQCGAVGVDSELGVCAPCPCRATAPFRPPPAGAAAAPVSAAHCSRRRSDGAAPQPPGLGLRRLGSALWESVRKFA